MGKNEIPIVKLQLGVLGIDAQLLMDIILQEPNKDGIAPWHQVRVENRMQGEEVTLLATQVVQFWLSISDLANQLKLHDLNYHTMLHCIDQNHSHLFVAPGCRLVADSNPGNGNLWGACGQAELMKKPKTLNDLQLKWEFGLGGNRGAKDFTPQERGEKNKY